MKNITIYLFTGLFLSCNLISPEMLSIKNNSEYEITVEFDKGLKHNITIPKNKGDFNLTYPGIINFTITIPEIGISKDYSTEIIYLEDKEIKFNIDM